jgi:hypothetical protein
MICVLIELPQKFRFFNHFCHSSGLIFCHVWPATAGPFDNQHGEKPMRRSLKVLSCFAILAIPLSVSPSAFAQQATPPSSQTSGANNTWSEDRTERQEFREERENIRAEHERLESEHDTLKMQCMDAKGQDRSECQEKKEALRQRQEALHERMKALHEKVEATHPQHHHHTGAHKHHDGKWKKHHDMKNQSSKPAQPAGSAPAPSTAPVGSQ